MITCPAKCAMKLHIHSKLQRWNRWCLEWICNFIPHFIMNAITYTLENAHLRRWHKISGNDFFSIFLYEAVVVYQSWLFFTLSGSSNFISRRIQYYTFHTHNSSTISQMYSSGGCQRSSVAHRADNRYFNNDTAVGKQGARGNIYFLFSQMCRAHYIRNMSGSIRVSLTFAYSLMIRHGAHKYKLITTAKHACTWDIIKFNKFIYIIQWNVLW